MAKPALFFILSAVIVVTTAEIPPNYQKVNGHGIYKVSTDKKEWLEAQVQCENEQASLAVINSKEESKALKGLLHNAGLIKAHVGFEDRDADGTFKTIKQGDLSATGFNEWKVQPANLGEPMCGMMWNCGRLGETHCETKLNYICELVDEPTPV